MQMPTWLGGNCFTALSTEAFCADTLSTTSSNFSDFSIFSDEDCSPDAPDFSCPISVLSMANSLRSSKICNTMRAHLSANGKWNDCHNDQHQEDSVSWHRGKLLVTLAAVSVKSWFCLFFINLGCWFKSHSTKAQSYRDSATWSAAIPELSNLHWEFTHNLPLLKYTHLIPLTDKLRPPDSSKTQ